MMRCRWMPENAVETGFTAGIIILEVTPCMASMVQPSAGFRCGRLHSGVGYVERLLEGSEVGIIFAGSGRWGGS